MSNTYGYIYITTNKINGKRYIGQHKSVDWDYSYYGSGKLLNKSIKKYGIENFTCFPLVWAWSKEELNKLEIEYIAHYKPEYNISTGGNGGNLGEEVNRKLSENHADFLGEKHPMFGKYHTEKTKLRMSENHADFLGKKNPMFGKTGEKCPHYGKRYSEETKQKMSESQKRRWQKKTA
jgi:group I intron endonuclease